MTTKREKILRTESKRLPIIKISIIIISTVLFFINYDVDESFQEKGIVLVDPKNVTNQTLQDVPTEDKDMSTGLEHKND
ncbi:MAG TPA: hypothetical protein VFT83_05000 [Nitrososphaeraceae archaeon]|nr:hypothetical protein [Nitrososphaeraceae archaeon]